MTMKRYEIGCDCGAPATVTESGDGQWVEYQTAKHQTARLKAELKDRAEMRETKRAVDHALHPNGRCTCYGEGECLWCQATNAKIEIEETKVELDGARQRVRESCQRIKRLEAEVERLKKQHYADLLQAAMKGAEG